jgi:hypothetical protein
MAHDVFICHSSKDKKIADAICAKLEQNKIRCWIAPRDVVPGQDFAEAIVAAIHASKVTVFVFSTHSNESPHVSHELERSVSLGLPILPFRVDDVVPSPALEYFISSAHWLDALTPPLEAHIDRLVSTVAVLLEREVEPAVPTPTSRSHGRMSRRRWIAAGAGTAAVAGAVALGLVLTLGGGTDPGPATGTRTPTASATPSGKAGPFVDDFTTAVDPSWTWTNEDKNTWRVTPQGWLEIDTQESPPRHNLLLRDVPGTAYNVKVRLRFSPKASGFAGIVLAGDDPDNWFEYGWNEEGLSATEYKNGSLVSGATIRTPDVGAPANRDIRLILSVDGSSYQMQYFDSQQDMYLDWGPPESVLFAPYTRVGLMTYRNTGAAGTAAFDSIEFY